LADGNWKEVPMMTENCYPIEQEGKHNQIASMDRNKIPNPKTFRSCPGKPTSDFPSTDQQVNAMPHSNKSQHTNGAPEFLSRLVSEAPAQAS
jgi:hypothetical protein